MSHVITDQCSGCSVCSMKCPAGAIHGQKKEQYYIDKKLCMDCHVCGWWCGKSAILDEHGEVVAKKKPKEMPKAYVHADLCNGCGNCVTMCPLYAIEMQADSHDNNFYNDVAAIINKKCVGCGLCIEVCIKEAINVPGRERVIA